MSDNSRYKSQPPYMSIANCPNEKDGGNIRIMIAGSGTLSGGTVTITFPQGFAFSSTNYVGTVTPTGTRVTTADMLQIVSRTATTMTVQNISAQGPLAAATFDYICVGE